MQFARAAWRFLVALKDAMVLIAMLLFFGLLYAALSWQPNIAAIRDGALLLQLDGVISEQPASPTIDDFLTGGGSGAIQEFRLSKVVRAINASASDDRVKAIVLDLRSFVGAGQTSLTDVGDALARVKKTGKPIYAYANFYSDDSYQLAAYADEIWLDPQGGIIFQGPGGDQIYYKGLIDQLGITANVYRVGTYKSAVEPYLRSDQSPEAKQAVTELYAVLWQSWQQQIKKARPQAMIDDYIKDPAKLISAAGGDYSKLALEQKLVDRIGDKLAFDRFVATKVGVDETPTPDSFKAIEFSDYIAAHPVENIGSPIGVVTVAGEIIGGQAGLGMAASGRIAEEIYRALEEEEIKALVVRVNSPGGSVFGSEEIRLALLEAKRRKLPVVISMGDVAASGGYWVATAGDKIFAEPDTITGSIGIFAVLPSFEKFASKWGVTADGVQSTPLSGEPNFIGGFADDFNTVLQAGVENGYQDFIKLVAESRGKTLEQVDEVGQGRVWDGGTARQLGLVDGYGGMDEALAEAAKLAGIKGDDYHPQYLESDSSFNWFPIGNLPFVRQQATPITSIFGWVALKQKTLLSRSLGTARNLLASEDVQALCLECGSATYSKAPVPGFDMITYLFGPSPASAPR